MFWSLLSSGEKRLQDFIQSEEFPFTSFVRRESISRYRNQKHTDPRQKLVSSAVTEIKILLCSYHIQQ